MKCTVALFLLGHCGDGGVVATKSVSGLGGIMFSIPRDYEAIEADGELRVYLPSRERGRSPVNIVLTVSSAAPDGHGASSRSFGTRDVHFTVSKEDGGSGGELLRLKAWTRVDRGQVILDSAAQPDVGGDPDFTTEWGILSTLR